MVFVYIVFSIVWTLLITLPYANNFICKDVTRLHNILKLLKECLPLCITQFLLAYIISCPKYALDNFYSSEIQTYFTTIFMPATLIAGIFGMNFKEMPWLELPAGYLYALGLMGLIAIGMLIAFWRRKYV